MDSFVEIALRFERTISNTYDVHARWPSHRFESAWFSTQCSPEVPIASALFTVRWKVSQGCTADRSVARFRMRLIFKDFCSTALNRPVNCGHIEVGDASSSTRKPLDRGSGLGDYDARDSTVVVENPLFCFVITFKGSMYHIARVHFHLVKIPNIFAGDNA